MINFAFLIKLADEPHYIYHSSGGKFGHCISPGNCRQHSLDRRPALPTAECDCCPARRTCRAPAACRRCSDTIGNHIGRRIPHTGVQRQQCPHCRTRGPLKSRGNKRVFPTVGHIHHLRLPLLAFKSWRFQTYEDATDAVMELKNAFPAYRRELRVVRDRIRIVNRP